MYFTALPNTSDGHHWKLLMVLARLNILTFLYYSCFAVKDAWLQMNYPITEDLFKTAVLQYCQAGVTSGGIIDLFVIAPNTNVEAMNISMRIIGLCLDAFVIQLANSVGGPLARIHTFTDKTARMTSTPLNIVRPLALAVDATLAFV